MFTDVHEIRNGFYVLLVYALLLDKKTESYTNFMAMLIDIYPLSPKTTVVDFESAIYLVLLTQWPNIEHFIFDNPGTTKYSV